jgi:hypothetical protein
MTPRLGVRSISSSYFPLAKLIAGGLGFAGQSIIMLDPLSGLAVATAVATFIDFSGSLFKLIHDIRRTGGTTPQVQQLKEKVIVFNACCERLKATKSCDKGDSRHDVKHLLKSVSRCSALAQKILELLAGKRAAGILYTVY